MNKLSICKFSYGLIPKIKKLSSRKIKNVILKSKNDYVTNLDLQFSELIKNEIYKYFKNENIFSEEDSLSKIPLNDEYWVIDPIDGTSNAICEIGTFSISIACIRYGVVVKSLVYDVLNEDLFYSEKFNGSFFNYKKIVNNKNSHLIGMSTKSLIKLPKVKLKQFANLGKFRILGSQALHLCYVAIGRLLFCINYEARLWDDIAAGLILNESGGCYHSFDGLIIDNIKKKFFYRDLKSIGLKNNKSNILNIIGKKF